MENRDISKAMLDPASFFETPADVLADHTLTTAQKIELLSRWEYNASEEAVALEEGMPGEESDVLRQTLVALETLTGPIDVEHTGPSKQHGLAHLKPKEG